MRVDVHTHIWPRSFYEAARELSSRLTTWSKGLEGSGRRFVICSGGGPGIMEAANRGASEAKGVNVGLTISLPGEEFANPYVTNRLAFVFHYFFMRKFWFVNLAHAAVAFPGGFGTLDELFELLTLIQTGKAQRMPVVLFGHEFWDAVVNFRLLAERGLIAEEDLELFRVCDDVDSAFRHLVRGLEPDIALSPD